MSNNGLNKGIKMKILLVALLLLSVSCGKDGVVGVNGQPGVNGQDGIDGINVEPEILNTKPGPCVASPVNYSVCYIVLSGYYEGKFHREDGPAMQGFFADGSLSYEHYYTLGVRNTTTKPNMRWNKEGFIIEASYYKMGASHREGGPAKIRYYESGETNTERYYLNGYRHREDGPAYIAYSQSGEVISKLYYLNGESLTESEFNNL